MAIWEMWVLNHDLNLQIKIKDSRTSPFKNYPVKFVQIRYRPLNEISRARSLAFIFHLLSLFLFFLQIQGEGVFKGGKPPEEELGS